VVDESKEDYMVRFLLFRRFHMHNILCGNFLI